MSAKPKDVTEFETDRAATIHCCLCLNIDSSAAVAAATVINGYAICEQHMPTLTRPFSNFAELLKRATHNATNEAT